MLNKLTHILLQGIAKVLTRYANSIGKFLTEKESSARGPLSDYSDEGPPAHWLEKVRRGAPHLLDGHTSKQREFITHFDNKRFPGSEHLTSSHADEAPPAHWIKKVRQGAPYLFDKQAVHRKNDLTHFATNERDSLQGDQGESKFKPVKQDVFLNQSLISKRKSKADQNSLHANSPGQVPENGWFYSFKSLAGSFIHAKLGSKKEVENISENLKQKISQSADHNYSSNNTLQVSSEYKTTANDEIELNWPGPKNLSAKSPKKGGMISANNEQFKTPNLHHADRNPIKNTSDYNKKNLQQSGLLSEQTTIENRLKVSLYPPKKIVAIQQPLNDLAENLDSKLTNIPDKQISNNDDLKKTFELGSSRDAHFSFSNTAKEHAQRGQHADDNRPSITAESVTSSFASEIMAHQYNILASNIARPFQSELPRWPNLPDEMGTPASDSRWPQLPKEDWFKSDEADGPAFNFWQLQEDTKRKFLSEQEQRGKLWSA